jgi:capsid protein
MISRFLSPLFGILLATHLISGSIMHPSVHIVFQQYFLFVSSH